ncbi:hypothetical protein WOLCODRAFT_167870 [Wolfiporia cocos MD-104 SS10]|uniref:Uncharacterized protein n=1 Tax=Wolfiporia cocos (strain MD-104) TaxID=742152 RepID=A0A2H3JRH9_WOLCO|nr:hypothetical protein WOLCODRAFT_167870 [Wolfiporia cocos MD-104 SS10]
MSFIYLRHLPSFLHDPQTTGHHGQDRLHHRCPRRGQTSHPPADLTNELGVRRRKADEDPEGDDARVKFEKTMDSTKEVGSKAIGVGKAATATTEETASRAGTRLQDTLYKVCDRAQDDAGYHKAIDTLFDLAHKWVHRSLDSAGDVNCATSLDAFVNDPTPEKHLITGIRGLRTQDDDLRGWFDSFLAHLCKCVDERGYVRSKEAKEKGDSLRKEWKELLDADSEKGQKWKADVGKLKEEAREFRRAIDRDEDLRRVRRTHAKLCDDLEDSVLAEAAVSAGAMAAASSVLSSSAVAEAGGSFAVRPAQVALATVSRCVSEDHYGADERTHRAPSRSGAPVTRYKDPATPPQSTSRSRHRASSPVHQLNIGYHRWYRPETKQEKKARIEATAKATAEEKAQLKDSRKPLFVNKKASLVVIAHDVDPIELVAFIPALCRKMGVPYAIVKGKALLGMVVHGKTSAVLALQEANFTDKYEEHFRQWDGGVHGNKSTQMLRKRAKAAGQALSTTNASKL